MSRSISFRLLLVATLSIAMGCITQPASAQRGGFHGGGFRGGSGFHSGGTGFRGSFGGARSGGFGSFHGGRGFGGFGRGFRGYPYGGRFYGGFRRYGYPGYYSGFGFGLGWWPYWGGYPYWYGYGPAWGPYAYSYPYGYDYGYGYDSYDYPDDYARSPSDRAPRDNGGCRDYRHECPPRETQPNQNHAAPAKPSSGATGEPATTNYLTVASLGAPAFEPESIRNEGIRPAVRIALAALRTMPPEAREQQLNSGRYAGFSPEERGLLLAAFGKNVQPASN
jgi:hypothetical protein